MPKYRGPKHSAQPHLIQQILANPPPKIQQETAPELPVMCQYGFLCSHLRAQGKCSHPHPRSHFLFLNLVPPFDCLDDPAEELLSKRQKKERKIVEKTINAEINVEELRKREQAAKVHRKEELKKQILAQVDGKERKILETAGSESVEEFYKRLSELQTSQIAEIKKRAMLQLRKKNQALFKEAVEKQYRIANRLIKAAAKSPDSSLTEVYEDINHDTLATVRDFFSKYFSEQTGIPQEGGEQKIVLSKILGGLFKSRPEEYSGQAYFTKIKETDMKVIKANAEFFNLMVPSALIKGIEFNKFYLFEGSNFSLSSVGDLLNQDHLKTFTAKSKSPPEFPFGQLPDNIRKFKLWASKINAKFSESKKESKIIILIADLQFLVAQNLQQFEQEKQRERHETLKALMQIFHPVFIFLSSSKDSKNEETTLGKLLTPLPDHPVLFEKLPLTK